MNALPWTADLGDGTYRNPVLNADWSDPDVVRAGDDFYLTASTFGRSPGLPILHSADLVNWTIIGNALDEVPGMDRPRDGCGVWAPSLRRHGGRFLIFYGDPDLGVHVLSAEDPRGPWSKPHLIKPGAGLIDPCPFWDDDGQAYLVHAWARSRSGVNNRLTLHRMSPDADELLDEGRLIVDADLLPGYRTLEGPKLYKRDGWYWIFAPAGGVTNGWQSAFRSRDIAGPYEDRIVLRQGDTDLNGPHQGAWVATPDGDDWFLHFQDRGPYGRVVHLQPMAWGEDGWPVLGDGGTPVARHRKPLGGGRVIAPRTDDDFSAAPGPQWSWAANPAPAWWNAGGGRLRLACLPGPEDLRLRGNMLTQRFPAESFTATTSLDVSHAWTSARAGLAVLGATYAWIGLAATPGGLVLVNRTAGEESQEHDQVAPVPVPRDLQTVRLGVAVGPGAVCTFTADLGAGMREIGTPFTATSSLWVGAVLGLFAAGTGGEAGFGPFAVEPR